jgi:hypothetical protein
MNATAIVLAISLMVNAALGWAYLGQRDKTVVAVEKTGQAAGAAVACSTGVDTLAKQANTRHAEAAPKIEEAKRGAAVASMKADAILSTPATMPGDDCKSANDRVDAWWADRWTK